MQRWGKPLSPYLTVAPYVSAQEREKRNMVNPEHVQLCYGLRCYTLSSVEAKDLSVFRTAEMVQCAAGIYAWWLVPWMLKNWAVLCEIRHPGGDDGKTEGHIMEGWCLRWSSWLNGFQE